ncbi:MAG: histidinol-phosphate transaminase [Thermoguttaceae bacterium]
MSFFRPEIEAMAGYSPGEQPQQGGFIKLNTNENPYAPSPAVGAAIQQSIGRLQKYPDPLAETFRRRAAEVLNVDPSWILCGNGSDDILTIVTRALVGAGRMIRMPYPSYVLYRTLAELQGTRFEEIDFQTDWTLPERFASAEGAPRLVFLANPNSPSGSMIDPAKVLEIARELPCPLLVDEAYVDFAETNCLDLVARCEKIMVTRTLSKSYALAGLRFGFLIAQPHLIEQFMKVKDSYNCDALAIAAATAAIDDRAWLADNRAKIIATRVRLMREMRKLGFISPDSQANFTWNTLPNRSVRPIYEELKRRRILVRYMNYEHWGDGLRVSVGTEKEIGALLEQLNTLV